MCSSGYSKQWLRFLLACFMIWVPVAAQGRYRCMLKDFIRLGNSCYFLSSEIATWQEAHFRCRDRGSQLAVLASHYEDSTLRTYLERPEFAQLGRWIGGMWASGKWIWAAQGIDIDNDKSFVSEQAYQLGNTDQWMCLYMDPTSRYYWTNENCMRQFHYICEAPLARESDSTIDDASSSPSGGTISNPTTTMISTSHEEYSSVTTSTTPSVSANEQSGHRDETSNSNDASLSQGGTERETGPLVSVSLLTESPFDDNEQE